MTSLRRQLSCGSYVPAENRAEYEFERLVDDEASEISAIYLAERQKMTELRIGVVCQQLHHPTRPISIDSFWGDEPLSEQPLEIGESHSFFSQTSVSDFRCFEICLDISEAGKTCLGLRFYGSGGQDVILGQWRLDKHIERQNLPTSMILVNQTYKNRTFVSVGEGGQHSEFTKIEGVMIWWMGFKGSKVMNSSSRPRPAVL